MERNIVFCCDGTANQKGKVNTNVVHLLRRIPTHGPNPREPHSAESPRRQHQQILAYEPGVGTFSPLGFGRENVIGTTLGKLFGHGLTANIENGYRFLMQQVREGDRVYLLSFSRGAYAVRALSGMLRKCGLLYPGREDRIAEASRLYTGRDNEDAAARFRKQHARPRSVHFIGAWDTVGSLGYLYRNRPFFETRLSPEKSPTPATPWPSTNDAPSSRPCCGMKAAPNPDRPTSSYGSPAPTPTLAAATNSASSPKSPCNGCWKKPPRPA